MMQHGMRMSRRGREERKRGEKERGGRAEGGEEGRRVTMYNERSAISFVKGVDGAARCTLQNELARSSVQQTRLLALSNPEKARGRGRFPPCTPPPRKKPPRFARKPRLRRHLLRP
jgi:hypothetical protein